MTINFHEHMSFTIRDCGLPSVAWLSEKTNVSRQTLNNWHTERPELFKIILIGAIKVYKADS